MAYTVAVLADHQIPYHDEDAIEAVNKYLHVLKPDEIVINGDFMDFPMLSTKFKRNHTTRYALQTDIDEGKYVLQSHRKAAPKAKITWLEGNHELRLRSFVEEQADAFEPLLDTSLAIPTLFELDKYKVDWVQGWDTGNALWERDGLRITHGSWHSKSSAAKSHMGYYGSVIFAHIHRPTIYGETDYSGVPQIARSVGCLCNVSGDKQPPRAGTTPGSDWIQGFGIVHFGAKRYQVHSLDIINGTVIGLNGKEYHA
jgi:predicted phosphodiesterase